MKTRARSSRPSRGEAVYEEDFMDCDQPNGTIIMVHHEERTVTVQFSTKGARDPIPRLEDYEFDEMEWTDKLGGLWIIRR